MQLCFVSFKIQAAFTMSLSTYRYDSLFDYGYFLDDKDGGRIASRHNALLASKTQRLLERRNEKRMGEGQLTYPYFLPRWLPNGIQT